MGTIINHVYTVHVEFPIGTDFLEIETYAKSEARKYYGYGCDDFEITIVTTLFDAVPHLRQKPAIGATFRIRSTRE